MKLYHRTFAAEKILQDGFKDATRSYLTSNSYTGVWFSDKPLDVNEGANGDVVLTIEMPEKVFMEHEWVEDGKGYREALIPADVTNRYGPPIIFLYERCVPL